MYVPNYVPEPQEVPNNVTQERYRFRLVFVRRVVFAYGLSLGPVVASFLAFRGLSVPIWSATLALVALITLLEIQRIVLRGRASEAKVAAGLLLPVLVAMGFVLRQWATAGVPVWALLPGPLALVGYTALCGRDFSFVGAYFLSIIPAAIAVAAVVEATGLPPQTAYLAHSMNAAWLVYVVYDLASLMARRRSNEIPAAVLDLYRDVFNIFGYVPRVIHHWRKHRIWNDVIVK